MPPRKAPRIPPTPPAASRPHMPGYGLKDANSGTGLLPWSWALERLTKSHNYLIATTRPDGRPHIMIVWGLWFHDAFSFSTGRDSRKARNLAANPHCVVTTENPAEAVILEGVTEELPVLKDPALLKSYILAYKKKYDYQMDGSEGNFYAVRPRVVFGLLEKDFLGATTRWQFPDG